MAARVSEAIVLRTFPLREADLIVSFFTRDQGKLRGVARRARRPGNRFGSSLERLCYIRVFYDQRENRELVNLESCEILRSRFGLASDYGTAVALDYLVEVSEQLLPAGEPGERFFRLMLAVSEYLNQRKAEGLWPAVTYFALWAVRLSGFLPALRLSEEDGAIAEEMLRKPVSDLTARQWKRQTAAGLRRELNRLIEEHVERKLLSPALLESLP